MRRQNHIARDLGSPKYRQRVIPSKKNKPSKWNLDFEDQEDDGRGMPD